MRVRVSPTWARIDFWGIIIILLIAVKALFGLEGYELVLAPFFSVGIAISIKNDQEYLVMVSIAENKIVSKLFFKERCTVSFNRPVYISFFQEDRRGIPDEKYHVMVSNWPLPDFEPGTRLATYDRSKQIMFPDTEKTRRAITPLLSSEFCILQGDAPPPVEELRKKREKKKEEPPVMKREKSPDDPPPFTGKWNGRF